MAKNRDDARREILKAANKVRASTLNRLGMRHIQQAVCIVRHQQLVGEKTLALAGYRAHRRRR